MPPKKKYSDVKAAFEKRGWKLLSKTYSGARHKLVFECELGHKHLICWDSFKQNPVCAVCSGKTLTDSNRLSIINPDLCKDWGIEKNFPLKPDDVSYGSHKKVGWLCQTCGYKWDAVINERNRKDKPSGCSACSGRAVTDKNRLSILHPKLCEEWDFEKNFPLMPEDVSYGFKKKIWWRCSVCKYSWVAPVYTRTSKESPTGCPACTGKVVTDNNRLSITNPDFYEEWDFEKNFPLTPDEVSFGSSEKVFWICKVCGYKWRTVICSRAGSDKTGCPQCGKGPVSKISQRWLDVVGVPEEQREVLLKDLGIRVDGFDTETNTVFEFLGDFWHGNPTVCDMAKVNRVSKVPYTELFDKTVERLFLLRRSGYNLNIIWEEDFKP